MPELVVIVPKHPKHVGVKDPFAFALLHSVLGIDLN